ncbi:MAG: ribbon-helix-helix protein, CopG family [Gammaproteobacteria bacterium]|nr:ribbon-helix-helix protein, CopG family [Gammaproteobacteria bacterium]
MPSKHRVTVSLSPEDHRALAMLSEKSRVSQAWIARQALSEFLERHRDDQLQLPFELSTSLRGEVGRPSAEGLRNRQVVRRGDGSR